MNNKKVWLVTGASKGLGLSLIKQLLSSGYGVAATSRNIQELTDAVAELATTAFLPLTMNLQSEESVGAAVDRTVDYFGNIDVVVNNAGYGLTGALEELSDAETRANFEVNVFGMLNVIRKTMPYLRKQESGHIFNISSIGGFTGNFPGFGVYCATKFAVQGLTESLAAEAKDFNIRATVVYPGYFRTSFLTGDSLRVPENPIAAYTAVRSSQEMHEQSINGNQPGDPEKAAAAMIHVAESEQAPLHLFLGEDAYNLAQTKIDLVETELENWKSTTLSTAF